MWFEKCGHKTLNFGIKIFLDTKAVQWKHSRIQTNPYLRYIHKFFGKKIKFHSRFHIPSDLVCTFSSFYQDIITPWCNYYSSPPTLIVLNNFFTISLCAKCPNTEFFLVCIFLRIQSENRKMRTRKNSVFGHFSHSAFMV